MDFVFSLNSAEDNMKSNCQAQARGSVKDRLYEALEHSNYCFELFAAPAALKGFSGVTTQSGRDGSSIEHE